MSGFEDDSDAFDSLLAAIEEAATNLGVGDHEFTPVGTLDGDGFKRRPTALTEAPKSLVDLRALTADLPLSHEPYTQSLDDIDLPVPGSIVDDKYEVLGEATRTTLGFGVKHVVLRKRFVLQFLSPTVVDDPILWPKFQGDIRAAGMLGHEHLEYVTDLGHCPTFGAYIVKELIEGPTFGERLREGAIALEEAVDFAHDVGSALSALHEIGIIHGRLSPESLRMATGNPPIWKVLDVCIPGRDEILLAPEQRRGEATGPQADQYALAYLTASLILGEEPDDGALDAIRDDVADVLGRALCDEPLERYDDVDAFIAALHEVVPRKRAPTVDPFDRREATRNVARTVQAPSAAKGFGERPRSLLIEVAPSGATPKVTVEFASGARFRREYRRNILAGGLFVPTAEDLSIGATAQVEMRFPFRDATVTVDGLVVSHDPGADDRPRGYGIAFDPDARAAIEEFATAVTAANAVPPTATLKVKRALDKDAALGAGEAFLLSRLRGTMTVGAARALFTGLPYDFDECLAKLTDGGWLEVEGDTPRAPSADAATVAAPSGIVRNDVTARAPTRMVRAIEPAGPDYSDVARVIETVDYFEDQGNFMAASRTLEAAAEQSPQVAVYFNRLALVRARFDMDLRAARTAIRRARELDPTDEDYRGTERYVATLIEIAAIRVVWEKDFAGRGVVRWANTDPTSTRAGFVVGPAYVEVDWRTGTAKESRVEKDRDYAGPLVGDERFELAPDAVALRYAGDTILELPGCTDPTLIRCADAASAMLVAKRADGQQVAVWVDPSGDAIGEYVFADSITEGALRSDGKFAARSRDGSLLVADLIGGTKKTVATVSVPAGALSRTPWPVGKPLVAPSITDSTAQVTSIDVDLLCG